MRTIPLAGKTAAGRVALVDDDDYCLVAPFRWNVSERARNGRTHGPYAFTSLWHRDHCHWIKMHRLITGWPMVDHIDHNGLNNQRSNLRPVTVRQNLQNMRGNINTTSAYKGVCWDKKRGRWLVQIAAPGRGKYVGVFLDEIEAARAYDAVASEAFGEFACLNFPAASAAAQ